jgi:hypothetical protein
MGEPVNYLKIGADLLLVLTLLVLTWLLVLGKGTV